MLKRLKRKKKDAINDVEDNDIMPKPETSHSSRSEENNITSLDNTHSSRSRSSSRRRHRSDRSEDENENEESHLIRKRHSASSRKHKSQASTGKSDYHRALEKLDKTLKSLPKENSALFVSGCSVYREVYKLGVSSSRHISQETLTKILDSTTRIVAGNEVHPSGDEGYRKELKTFHSLSGQVSKFPLGKVLGGAMLALIGTAIVVASGIVAAASFGLLTPASFLGIVLGGSILVGSMALIAGGVGVGAVMGSGMLFFSAGQKNILKREIQEVENSARTIYGFN